MRRTFPIFALALLTSTGCGKEKPPTTSPDPVAAEGEGDASVDDQGAPKAWGSMSFDDKKQHMMDVVTPTMAGVFQGFSAEHFAEFNCTNCHGPGANEGKFQMPSASLPKLPPNGDFAALFEAKPEVMSFMAEKVVPQMAATLDVAPYDPETHEGFGCYACHQAEG